MTKRNGALCVVLATSVAASLWMRAPAPVHTDFCSYYSAGRLVLEGRAVAAYDWAELDRAHREIHEVGPRAAGPFLYSPLLLLPAAAFAAAPLSEAAALNRALGAVALGAGLAALLIALEGWLLRFAVAGTFAIAHVTRIQFGYANWTILLFALVAFAALALRRERLGAAGVLVSGAIHLKAFVLFAVAPLAFGTRRRALAWAAAGGLALVLLSIPVTGAETWRRFGTFLLSRGDAGVTPFYNKCSLAANLARLTTEPREWVATRRPVETLPVRAIFWAGLPLAALGSWRLRRAPDAGLAFGLAWMLLFVPQIWEHTEILLFAALPALERRLRMILLLLLAATFVYGPVQQSLLLGVLAGSWAPGALAAFLLVYPVLNLVALARAPASGARTGREPRAGARAA